MQTLGHFFEPLYNSFDRDNKCNNLRMIEDEILFSVNLTEDSIDKLTIFVKMIMVIITLNTSNCRIVDNTI